MEFRVQGGPPIRLTLPPRRVIGSAVVVALVLILLIGVLSCFFTVQPEEQGVVKRFGAVVRIADPGLNFRLPFGMETVQLVPVERVLKEEFGFRTAGVRAGRTQYADRSFEEESLMLTGDLNMIDVEWVVQYRVKDPVDYLYKVREATRTLRDISESVMRRAVGNRLGSEVLTVARVEIQQQVRDEIQAAMDLYDAGIHIITVELQDVVPPARVQPAFNEVNEARQVREQTINEAQRQVNQRIPQAEGTALRRVAEAEGYATERINRAEGESARFRAVLEAYLQAPEVTRARMYLEAMREVLPQVNQVLVVQEGQMPPLPLLDLNRPAAGEARR